MPLQYRRPGVYLEESLLVNPAEVSGAITVAAFVGACSQGPINEPILVESWSDFVARFGGFGSFADPKTPTKRVLSYLPYAVYSYFQSGGRNVYIIRAVPDDDTKDGDFATTVVNGTDTGPASLVAFTIQARSVGTWGANIKYDLAIQAAANAQGNTDPIFTLRILLRNSQGYDEVVETFPSLSVRGLDPGTRKVDSAVNDPFSGSAYVFITGVNDEQPNPVPTSGAPVALTGGVDPDLPSQADLQSSAALLTKVEGPIALNIVGYLSDASMADGSLAPTVWVGASVNSTAFPDRQDIFIINDNAPPRIPNQKSVDYMTAVNSPQYLGYGNDSYTASYTPWIIIPDPQSVGSTLSIPPGGGVAGVMARIDATIGVFRAPAGVIAGISNAVGVQTKFTDSELGTLNAGNINAIRSVVGAGISIMGARTRKTYGADRYVSPRRTLIYIKEVLRRSTQFAVFENNDQRLWAALRMGADRILRPLWEAGGLRGNSPAEAYYINCDETINTPTVIQSGEVRMEIGVALEYPAEFVVIRITQFDRGNFSSEVTPAA